MLASVLIVLYVQCVCLSVIVLDPATELVQSRCLVSSELHNRSITQSLLQ